MCQASREGRFTTQGLFKLSTAVLWRTRRELKALRLSALASWKSFLTFRSRKTRITAVLESTAIPSRVRQGVQGRHVHLRLGGIQTFGGVYQPSLRYLFADWCDMDQYIVWIPLPSTFSFYMPNKSVSVHQGLVIKLVLYVHAKLA